MAFLENYMNKKIINQILSLLFKSEKWYKRENVEVSNKIINWWGGLRKRELDDEKKKKPYSQR